MKNLIHTYIRVTSTQMQDCLNEDYEEFTGNCRKYMWIPVSIAMIALCGTTLLVISIFCNTTYRCSDQQQYYTLYFGMILFLLLFTFVGVPCITRIILNCVYDRELYIITSSPLGEKKKPSKNHGNHKYPLKSSRQDYIV